MNISCLKCDNDQTLRLKSFLHISIPIKLEWSEFPLEITMLEISNLDNVTVTRKLKIYLFFLSSVCQTESSQSQVKGKQLCYVGKILRCSCCVLGLLSRDIYITWDDPPTSPVQISPVRPISRDQISTAQKVLTWSCPQRSHIHTSAAAVRWGGSVMLRVRWV